MFEQRKADCSSVKISENDVSTKKTTPTQTDRDLSRKVDEILSRDSWITQQVG
jgi:hypothetical protein